MERSHAVFLSLQNRPPRPIAAPERAVLCLGNFDGVHVAHRALLRAGVRSARAGGCPCGVFCFYRPSSDFFPALPTPETVYASGTHLCSLSEKLARFAEEGVDFVWLCSFSAVRDIPAGTRDHPKAPAKGAPAPPAMFLFPKGRSKNQRSCSTRRGGGSDFSGISAPAASRPICSAA